jgi:hypothetical protein
MAAGLAISIAVTALVAANRLKRHDLFMISLHELLNLHPRDRPIGQSNNRVTADDLGGMPRHRAIVVPTDGRTRSSSGADRVRSTRRV